MVNNNFQRRIEKRRVGKSGMVACAGLLALFFVPRPAFAFPGEDLSVIAHCGRPSAENLANSPVSEKRQRDLYYGDTILHFEPMGGGWSFTSGWQGHLPISKRSLMDGMPCFRAAMEEVAVTPPQAIDPTIAVQTVVASGFDGNGFGTPFLWVVLGLVILVLILIILPSQRPQNTRVLSPKDRSSRRPDMSGFQRRQTNPDRLDL